MRYLLSQLAPAIFTLVYCIAPTFAQAPIGHSVSAQMAPAPPSSSGVFLNNKAFDIPFTVERTGSQPVEVQLFVSRDQGRTWNFSARKPATENGFPFQASEDGNFWFSTRTIDARGVSYPTGPMTAQLRVVVDTSNPKVEIAADTDAQGQVLLSYVVADSSVKEEFRLEYMTDAVRQWAPVAIQGRPGRRPQDGALVGRVAWQPNTPWRHLYLRMIVQDRAGNQTVVNKQVEKPRVAAAPTTFAGSPFPRMNGQIVSGPTSIPPAHGAGFQPGFPSTSPQYVPANPNSQGAAGYVANHPAAPYRGHAVANPSHSMGLTPAQGHGIPAAPAIGSSGSVNQPPLPVDPQAAMRPLPQNGPYPGWNAQTNQGIVTSGPGQTAAQRSPSPTPTPSVAPRVSRSRQFSLDYEIDSIGNGGIDAVELWGTRDNGQTWKRWEADPDKQSPFDIEVARDGLVGFRIVVVAANGLTTPRPAPGELADINILIDTTAPRARLLGAAYGQDEQAGSLIIDYGCSDEHFGGSPISLSYSDKPDGQWKTIASGLENTGRYMWAAGPNLPRQIYLRVEAKDKAGNVGIHSLDIPVAVEGLSPQGRIRGFNPIEDQSQAQQAASPSASFK